MKKRVIIITALLSVLILAASCLAYAGEFSTYAKWTNETQYHLERYSNCLLVDGVDISEWQGNSINWTAAKADGVDFVFIRAAWRGYGLAGSLHEDVYFRQNIAGAKAAGIMVGVYIFSQATSSAEAAQEANYVCDILASAGYSGKDLDLPVIMDWEFAGMTYGEELGRMYNAGLAASGNQSTMTPMVNAFYDAAKARGYKAGLYASTSFLDDHISRSILYTECPVWVAQYYYWNQYYGGYYDFWQYESKGVIPGLPSGIDVNYWYINRAGSGTINSCTAVVGENGYYKYKNSAIAHKPRVTVKNGNTVLKEGTDYKVGYITNTAKGTAYAYIYGMGSYTGHKLVAFTITDKVPDAIESADPIQATCNQKLNEVALPEGYHWADSSQSVGVESSVSKTFKAVHEAAYTVGGETIEDISVKVKVSHTEPVTEVTEKASGEADGATRSCCEGCGKTLETGVIYRASDILLEATRYVYDGTAKTPAVTVRDSQGNALAAGTDYDVSYKNNTASGVATAVITFKGERYTGKAERSFAIIDTDLEGITIELEQDEYQYDGKAKTPRVTATDSGGNTLIEGVDYTLEYSDNIKPGNANVKLKMQGLFSGEINQPFRIVCNHKFSKWTIDSMPTPEKSGSKSRTCSICGHKEEAEITYGVKRLYGKLSGYSGTGEVILTLTNKDGFKQSKAYTGNSYEFAELEIGEYTLKLSSDGDYIAHEYTLVITEDTELDVCIFERGDTNCDGLRSASDITHLARYVAHIVNEEDEYTLKLFDTDKNSEINASDITHLARFIAHIIGEL